jgi:hypothetical protein
MGDMRYAYNILVGEPEGKSNLVDLGVDGKIILERIRGKRLEGCGLDDASGSG